MSFSPSFEEGDHPSVDEGAEDETVETPTLTDAEMIELAEAERSAA